MNIYIYIYIYKSQVIRGVRQKRCAEHILFDIHFNQQLETSTEDPDSDSPTPATLSYPHLVENCCAPSVFVNGRLEYECPSLSACPLHQDVSPHTHNWYCVISGRTNEPYDNLWHFFASFRWLLGTCCKTYCHVIYIVLNCKFYKLIRYVLL